MRAVPHWRTYAMISAVGTGLYFLLPGGSLAQALVMVGLQAAMVAAMAVGIRMHRPARPLFWRLMLSAQVVSFIAYLIWYVYPVGWQAELTFPGPSDPPFLLSYTLLVAALAVLVRVRRAGRNRADLIDATIIALGLGFVFWIAQIERTYQASGLTPVGRAVAIAYPLFDLALAALAVRLAVGGGRRSPAFWLLGLFVGGQLAADIGYAETVLRGTFRYGAPFFAGWLLSFAFLGAAALHPSMRELTEPSSERKRTTLRRRLPFLASAALVGPAVILIQDLRGAQQNLAVDVVFTAVIFLLVLARISDLMVDVAEHERVQERLSELALIVESSDDAILGWNTDGVITHWNRGATELYGYQPEEMLGRRFSVLLPPHRVAEADTMLAQVLEGERLGNFDTERLTKDGRTIEVSVTLSAIRDSNGTIVGGATIARDITERKRLEVELAAARDQALEASRLKSEFLANMSHEVRTPMNGVLGLTGLLLGTDLDPRQRQYAEGVQGAAEALLGVINDILDFSKIEAGKLDLEVVDLDLRQVVEETADLLAQPAQRKGLELVAYCHPELPTALRGDPGRLRQVLINLVSNAVKFTERGEVVVKAVPDGEPSQREDGPLPVRFEVVDTGIGIDPAAAERLLEPFAQADASTTRRYGGTGLGLAISNQLVRAMGGELHVDSRLGEGSRFWFVLPLQRQPETAASVKPQAHRLQGLRVLIVDDNETNRLILWEQLRAWQLQPEAVADGAAALEALHQAAGQGAPFEVALLDMCMPHMDGLDLARRISGEPPLATTRLILLSSAAEDLDAASAASAGIVARLTKPVRQSQLYDALMRATAHTTEVAAPAPRGAAASAGGRRGHLLVVEDNLTNQLVALGILDELQFSADVAANGLEALQALETQSYAAVLMDCQMPEMDGYQATGEIRRREGDGRRTPIIAMTAGAMQGERERCLAAGMDDYVSKPVDPAVLEETLLRWVTTPRPQPPVLAAPAGGSAPTVAEDTSPMLDRARLDLLRGMGKGDGALLAAMVDAFVAELAPITDQLREAAEAAHAQGLAQQAHRLRGAAANLGATQLVQVCAELESRAAAGDLAGAHAEVEAVITSAAAVAEALASEVGDRSR